MQKRHVQLSALVAMSGVLAFLNSYANTHFLYFEYWWFDIVMHFLGGLVTGFALLWLYHHGGGRFFDQRRERLFLIALVGTLIVGVLWEVFESIAGIHALEGNIVPDTSLDLVMDLFGALAAFLVFIPQKSTEKMLYTSTNE